MNRTELIGIIDSACWSARRYGHDAVGLDREDAVEVDGEHYHPAAVSAADAILALPS
jgi:hypothetical protein